ncbi:DUF6452 family protein [Xanthomarina sp. F1114]|uniref:DUF6452 family protein n=1 Tax=Xanthomarina sp. F1114 TaxID=2996019 RepID=UPI00225DD161|nr:DUF6452 family protein [Xanthomarina sp. F1114]MCX7548663.1 DUF6452 family protein [Xanthomarina sp. F1114]
MKKYNYFIIPILVFFTLFFNCEKDDICSETTETTPKMHIAFYDINFANEEDTPKNVSKLRITGVGHPEPDVLPGYDGSANIQEVYFPLKTTENSTQYILHKGYKIDDNDTVLGNPDTITINYIRKEIYVSRACGYKTIFENVVITIEDDGDNWVKLARAENDNQTVEHETDIHYKIYH